MDKNQFRGKAVVLFSQNEAAEATIQHRRKKEINRCHAHDDYKLAVFNLPKDITDQDLQKLFAGFGKLRTAKIMQRDQTYSRGVITYEKEEAAQEAMNMMNGKEIQYGY